MGAINSECMEGTKTDPWNRPKFRTWDMEEEVIRGH